MMEVIGEIYFIFQAFYLSPFCERFFTVTRVESYFRSWDKKQDEIFLKFTRKHAHLIFMEAAISRSIK